MLKSKTRFGYLKRIFSSGSGFDANIARLVVLFEDLRLETYGMGELKIGALDLIGDQPRRLYFVRRATVTLFEFCRVMHDLNGAPKFKSFKRRSASIHGKNWKPWDDAISGLDQTRSVLKRVRDATGAHFDSGASVLAVSNLSADTIGKIEVVVHPSRKGAGCKFYFAGDLAAAATVGDLKGRDAKDAVGEMIQAIVRAQGHASTAMHQLAFNYLWDRFG